MSECIRGSYDDALYKSTYALLYFTVSCVLCVSICACYNMASESQYKGSSAVPLGVQWWWRKDETRPLVRVSALCSF